MINTLEQPETQQRPHENGANDSSRKIKVLEGVIELRGETGKPSERIIAQLERLYQQQEQKELSPQEATLEVFQKNFGDIFGATQKPDSQFKLKVFLGYIGVNTNSNDLNKLSQNFFNYLLKIGVAEFSAESGYANYTVFTERVAEFKNIQTVFPTFQEIICHREDPEERQKPSLDIKDYQKTQDKKVITQIVFPVILEENIAETAKSTLESSPEKASDKVQKESSLNTQSQQSERVKITQTETRVEIVAKENPVQTETRKSETIEIKSSTPIPAQAKQITNQKANSSKEVKTISARLNRLLKSNQKTNLYLKLEQLKQNPTQIKRENPTTFNISSNNFDFTQTSNIESPTNLEFPLNTGAVPTGLRVSYEQTNLTTIPEYSTIPSFSRYQGFKNTNLDIPDQNQFSTIPNQSFLPEIRSSPEVTDDFQVNPFNFQNLGKIEFAPSQALVQPSQLESQQVDSQPDLSLNFSDFQGINFEPPKEIPQTISSSEISKLNEFDSIPVTQFQPPIFENSYKPNLGFLNQPNTETFQENNPFNQFNYQPTQAFQPKAEPYFEPRFESNFSNPQTELFPQSSNPSLEPKARLDSLKSSSKTQPEPILSETQAIESTAKSEPIEPKIQDDFVNPTSEISQTKTEPTIEANNITKFARKETQTTTDETPNSLKTHSESAKIESSPANNIVKFARRESLSASIETEIVSEINSNSSNSDTKPVAQQTTPEMVMA